MAKAVLGLTTTSALIERLTIDRALRRICGFLLCSKLLSEAIFFRAFEEFAKARLAGRVDEALTKAHLGNELIGHLSREGTAIEARERPATRSAPVESESSPQVALMPSLETTIVETDTSEAQSVKHKRGRPRRGEACPAAKELPLARQRQQALAEMHKEIPTVCDRGTKGNA